jgi:hypothetical protein
VTQPLALRIDDRSTVLYACNVPASVTDTAVQFDDRQ